MWAAPEDDPRSYGNPVGEKATYREYLGNYRLTIEMKCEGLEAGQLARRPVPPSALSLLGLVRHLAQVENHWFQRVLQGRTGPARLAAGMPGPALVTRLPGPLDEAPALLRRRLGGASASAAGPGRLAPGGWL